MNYEFTFNFNNSDPLYITHNTNIIDNELLQFLININVDFTNIINFKVNNITN